MIKLALRSALSDRASEDKIVVVDTWALDTPKTKDAATALATLGLDGSVLVVLDRDDTNAALSFRNLPAVQIIHAGELNAYDVLSNDYIVFTTSSLEAVNGPNAEPTDATKSPSVSAGTAASVKAEAGVASAGEAGGTERAFERARRDGQRAAGCERVFERAKRHGQRRAHRCDGVPSVSAGTAASVTSTTAEGSASDERTEDADPRLFGRYRSERDQHNRRGKRQRPAHDATESPVCFGRYRSERDQHNRRGKRQRQAGTRAESSREQEK